MWLYGADVSLLVSYGSACEKHLSLIFQVNHAGLIFPGYQIPLHKLIFVALVVSVQTQPTNSISCLVKPDAPPSPPAAVFLYLPYCLVVVVVARRPSAQAEGATVPSVSMRVWL